MSVTYEITSIDGLQPVVEKLISLTDRYSVFVFDGEMGAGKTTLIGQLCNKLGIQDVSSPTYAIVNTYSSDKLGEVYHFDFYRLEGEREAIDSGLDEMIDSGNLCFLEWADRISKLLPDTYVKVGIKQNEEIRNIDIELV